MRKSEACYCRFGADAMRKRLRALRKEIKGVRAAEDIEYVHRMRVASRRLRSAMVFFEHCLPPDRFPTWQKRLRRISRALGAARDTDVQIEFLRHFLGRVRSRRERPGIERLLLRLQQRRARLQKKVVRALDRLEKSWVLDEMEHALNSIRAAVPRPTAEQLYLRVAPRAARAIARRLDEMLAFEPAIHDPSKVEELHQMRIAAKRLRYTMEVFAPAYGDRLNEAIELARVTQDWLGEIHDCDVWVTFLPQFIEEEQERMLEFAGNTRGLGRLRPGLALLERDRRRERERLYREFLAIWEQGRRQAVWDNLRHRIQIRRPRNARPAESSRRPPSP